MASVVEAIVHCFTVGMSPDANARRGAEGELARLEGSVPQFSLHVLQVIDLATQPEPIRQAAAVYFKNLIKRCWVVTEEEGVEQQRNILSPEERGLIKVNLVSLMLKSPESIQKQLMEAISLISEADYPKQWLTLLPELIEKLSQANGDYRVINGILNTIYSIFKKYRNTLINDTEKVTELKYSIVTFAPKLLELFKQQTALSQQAIASSATPTGALQALQTMLKIFFTLNVVDLPEFFEDHMDEWMSGFLALLSLPSNFIPSDDDEPTLIILVQAGVCENINLYIEKYDEEFGKHLQAFLPAVWQLLTTVTAAPKFDPVVINGIKFLTSVSRSVHHTMFGDAANLQMLCEKIIIPNMFFRDSDEENFEDNAREYIRRDIEGSDSDTRRRAATELVKGLRKHFEQPVTHTCASYITSLLNAAQQDWKAKDVAIYLVIGLTVTTQTAAGGVVTTNAFVPILEFFRANIAPEFVKPNALAVLQADALKFTTTFRNQIPKEDIKQVLPSIIQLLASPSYVVSTYVANFLERLLVVRDKDANGVFNSRYTQEDLRPFLQTVLTGLFSILEKHFADREENEYLMKAIMRVLAVGKTDVLPYIKEVVDRLNWFLKRVCENPSNPIFSHYLFECISIATKLVANNPNALPGIENPFFESFAVVIEKDVAEFAPYVFQCLALTLELREPRFSLPMTHRLLPEFIKPQWWLRSGNIPALVRLLQAYLRQASIENFTPELISGILGVWQKLISSTATDHEGFYLLEAVVQYLPKEVFQANVSMLFQIIFMRIHKAKNEKFTRSFVVFLSLFIGKHGAAFVVDIVDAIQNGVFGMVIDSLILPTALKVTGVIERKMVAIALTRLLTETPKMLEIYSGSWSPLLQAAVGLLEGQQQEDTGGEDDKPLFFEAEEQEITAFTQLSFAQRADPADPFVEINPKAFLATQLQVLSSRFPGKLPALIPSQLHPLIQAYALQAELTPPYLH